MQPAPPSLQAAHCRRRWMVLALLFSVVGAEEGRALERKRAAMFMAPVLSGEAWCPPGGELPRLILKPITTPVTLDHTRSLASIREQYRHKQAGDRRTAGLTDYLLSYELRTSYQLTTRSDGETCLRLTEARVEAGFKRMAVLIAREYAEGSCQYRVVHAHEQEHVAINQRGFARFQERAQAELIRLAGEMPAVATRHHETVRARYDGKLKEVMDRLFRETEKALGDDHAAIDTPAQYDAVQARCSRW